MIIFNYQSWKRRCLNCTNNWEYNDKIEEKMEETIILKWGFVIFHYYFLPNYILRPARDWEILNCRLQNALEYIN
jgi:hypothetical protein